MYVMFIRLEFDSSFVLIWVFFFSYDYTYILYILLTMFLCVCVCVHWICQLINLDGMDTNTHTHKQKSVWIIFHCLLLWWIQWRCCFWKDLKQNNKLYNNKKRKRKNCMTIDNHHCHHHHHNNHFIFFSLFVSNLSKQHAVIICLQQIWWCW